MQTDLHFMIIEASKYLTSFLFYSSGGRATELPYDPLHPTPIYSLRARAVCIDMEEGVLNELQRSPLGRLRAS
jgi:hypothetical protein